MLCKGHLNYHIHKIYVNSKVWHVPQWKVMGNETNWIMVIRVKANKSMYAILNLLLPPNLLNKK